MNDEEERSGSGEVGAQGREGESPKRYIDALYRGTKGASEEGGGSTVEVPLTQGLVALIDSKDADMVLRHKWYAAKFADGKYCYAVRLTLASEGKRRIWMHREILSPAAHQLVDHINPDHTLDNRRSNIRICTRSENARNRRSNSGCASIYKGVFRNHAKWQAKIKFDGRQWTLGQFYSEIEAAMAYDQAAKRIFGSFARVNFE